MQTLYSQGHSLIFNFLFKFNYHRAMVHLYKSYQGKIHNSRSVYPLLPLFKMEIYFWESAISCSLQIYLAQTQQFHSPLHRWRLHSLLRVQTLFRFIPETVWIEQLITLKQTYLSLSFKENILVHFKLMHFHIKSVSFHLTHFIFKRLFQLTHLIA